MSEIIDKLAPKFATMTQAQQIATATTIFGSSAAKAMTAVIDAGSKSYDESTAAVTRHNAVGIAAAQQQATLSGSFQTLKSTVVDFGSQLGTTLMPILQSLMSIVTQLVPIIGNVLKGAFMILTPIVQNVASTITLLVTYLKNLADFVKDVFTGDWSGAWDEVKNIFNDFVTWLDTPITNIEHLFSALPSNIKSAMEGLVDTIESPFITAFNFIIKLYDDTIGKIHVDILGFHLGAPSISTINDTFSKTNSSAKSGGDAIREAMEAERGHKSGISTTTDDTRGKDEYNVADAGGVSSSAKSAATKAASAAKSAASTLTSEVIKAIGEPASQAAASLRDLGVPATKAADVLHDAVKPFNDAVRALEQQGFDAADAVKIATAGSAEVAKEAKAAAEAAKKNATDAVSSALSTLSGITVNGIQVAGAVYQAAIGAAYAQQTGIGIGTGTGPTTPATPSTYAAVGSPMNVSHAITIAQGAIVINPAPGNTTETLVATQQMVNNMLNELLSRLQSGATGLSDVTA
jgi:hypothetical protein